MKEKEKNRANESHSYDKMIVKYLNENENSDKTRFEEEEKRLRKCFSTLATKLPTEDLVTLQVSFLYFPSILLPIDDVDVWTSYDE